MLDGFCVEIVARCGYVSFGFADLVDDTGGFMGCGLWVLSDCCAVWIEGRERKRKRKSILITGFWNTSTVDIAIWRWWDGTAPNDTLERQLERIVKALDATGNKKFLALSTYRSKLTVFTSLLVRRTGFYLEVDFFAGRGSS